MDTLVAQGEGVDPAGQVGRVAIGDQEAERAIGGLDTDDRTRLTAVIRERSGLKQTALAMGADTNAVNKLTAAVFKGIFL